MHDAKTYRSLIRPTRNAKEHAKALRSELSEPERILLWAIRSDKSTNIRFRSQEPLGPYIADFYCHPARLVIEIDGVQHNDQHIHDAQRDAWMRDVGIEVFRVSANEVMSNLQGVYNTMVARAWRRINELRTT